jgi:hypothetical protein
MIGPFSFRGEICRLPYALWSFGIFFSQHFAILTMFWIQGMPLSPDPIFYLMPFRWLVSHVKVSDLTLVLALSYLLVVTWALVALAFRRAADANAPEWVAAMAIAQIVQIPFILFLCFAPPVTPVNRARDGEHPEDSDWRTAALGVVVGVALILAAVAMGALVFGSYGYGMFVVSPLVVGAATGYLANRAGDIGVQQTFVLVACATLLGGLALVGVALEGLVCILMVAPIVIAVAVLGGALGRAIAQRRRRPPVAAVAVLPLVFAMEAAFPASTNFDATETIVVKAPPEWVWQSIVHTGTIDEPPALPFRLGVAYPLRGDVIGSGIGALRHGEFSTGTAIERVTEWAPNRKLAFVVDRDIPGMRELSPYEHVHAPHVVGYFLTTSASFELEPLPDGGTEIVEHTAHVLKLDPVFYWLPMARWVVHANNARVLAHISRQAEGRFRQAAAEPAKRNPMP